jgi:hypothetical protein
MVQRFNSWGVGGCAFASLLGVEYSNIPSKMTMIRRRKKSISNSILAAEIPLLSHLNTPHKMGVFEM